MSARGGKVRVGVIGAGEFADICHIPGIAAHPAGEVAAVCARNRERAAALAAKWRVPAVRTDWREVVADPGVDAVAVVTPNVTHAEIAAAALAAGKHVFCEKPLAMSAAQARELEAAAIRSGRVHMVAFTFRYLLGVRKLREMLRAGALGRLLCVRLWSREYKYLGPQARGGWRQRAELAGTGVLGDLGSHLIDLARLLAGDFDEMTAMLTHLPRELPAKEGGGAVKVDVDDTAALLFRTREGLSGDIFASWATPTHDRRTVEVVGENGALLANLTRGEDELLRLVRPGKPVRDAEIVPLEADPADSAPGAMPPALRRMMGAFVDACLSGRPGPMDATFSDGRAVQECIDAAVESSALRRWVRPGGPAGGP
jgi:predicted dehydrogenase